jgi:hypothetical protein
VYWRESERTAPHVGGSGLTNDFWGEPICKIIALYESFGGTYGLGRKNVDGSVGSPFLNFATAVNEVPSRNRRGVGICLGHSTGAPKQQKVDRLTKCVL